MESQKTFKVVTLGCRTNQYESQAYTDQLKKMGYREVGEKQAAELCIVNTCTVTESADSSSRHQIRSLKRQNPGAKLIVTGCLAERLPQEIAEMEEVDLVVPNKEKENLLSLVFPQQAVPDFVIENFSAHTRAFVKVQDGCNSFCTYCIIPYVRGRSRSRRLEDVLNEVRSLVAHGYKEVVITGINVGDYDGAPQEGESPVRLSQLVRAIDAVPGLCRLRVSSIDPDEIDEELTQVILEGKTTCPSMHIVLQSGSNVILKRMNRKYTREIFLDTVERLRAACPDFTVTTDIIVGFPGESEADFQDTLDVMNEVRFAKVHMFPYSERARTRAALYPNKVPSMLISERKQRVLRLAEQNAFELFSSYVGRTLSVLIEGDTETLPGYISGHTENFIPVFVPIEMAEKNDLIQVDLIENTPKGLIGKKVL